MAYRFADFHIDLARQELRRGGEPVRLEPQVFDVLVHLIRHRDNAVRRALGDDGNAQMFVRTLHKRGFRFVGEVNELPATPAPPAPAEQRNLPAVRAENGAESSIERKAAAGMPIQIDRARASVAPLPFENLSGEPENDYLSHGITEDLSRVTARVFLAPVLTPGETMSSLPTHLILGIPMSNKG